MQGGKKNDPQSNLSRVVTEETARLDGPTLEEVEFSFSSAG